ncbi:hypothetical protein ACLOJK_024367, partial [Asimina triloba]
MEAGWVLIWVATDWWPCFVVARRRDVVACYRRCHGGTADGRCQGLKGTTDSLDLPVVDVRPPSRCCRSDRSGELPVMGLQWLPELLIWGRWSIVVWCLVEHGETYT